MNSSPFLLIRGSRFSLIGFVLLIGATRADSEPTPSYQMLMQDILINADLWSEEPEILSAGYGFEGIIGVPGNRQAVIDAGGAWQELPGFDNPPYRARTSSPTPETVAIGYGYPVDHADALPVVFSWPVLPSTVQPDDFRITLNTGVTVSPEVVSIVLGCILVERMWPANDLPRVRAWWGRILLVNSIQLGIILLTGITWDLWFQGFSLLHISEYLNFWWSGLIAYVVSTFIYYWWHRWRHESRFFWRLCHQIHHSPRRIEVLTSFYKHPVEITLNSILSSTIIYILLGCEVDAAAFYTFLIAIAELFYHWNIRTPRWVGHLIQRPESHRIHHMYRYHTRNFADLPVWDMLFGTFRNARKSPSRCGYDDWREDRFEDMLAFRDVHAKDTPSVSPLHFLPTCIGCSKRWACSASRGITPPEPGLTQADEKNRDSLSKSS